ncbi:MAG: hypothetical protein OEW19_07310, partial [Acidobacteriota bacterium]|nr:hypothetical protein [Acidobacteriota bacterium]
MPISTVRWRLLPPSICLGLALVAGCASTRPSGRTPATVSPPATDTPLTVPPAPGRASWLAMFARGYF